MSRSSLKYLTSAVVASAFVIPTASFGGSKMDAPAESVVISSPVAQPVDWTGFYGGVSLGYGRGVSATDVQRDPPPGPPGWLISPSVSGATGSLRLGYDTQQGGFVYGGLLEANFGKFDGSAEKDPLIGGPAAEPRASYSNLMSIALRAGPVVNDGNTLLYGRLGLSRAKLTIDNIAAAGPWQDLKDSKTGTGLNVGFGAEHRLGRNISIFAEYNYHDVGKSFAITPASGPGPDWQVRGKGLHVISAGMNFRF